jgi:hypothetical protein
MHCFRLSVSSLRIAIDHMEQGRVEPPEPAPVEDTDPEQDQGKPQCILQHPLSFIYFFSYFMISHFALGHRSCIKDTFRSILDYPMARDMSLAMARRSCRLR